MTNKIALITGAAQRIGKELSEYLADKGFSLAIHYHRSKKEALELQAKLLSLYPKQQFKIFQCDLGQMDEVELLMDKVMQFYPRIDLLINNASVFDPGKVQESSLQLLTYQIDVNLKAPFLLIRDYAQNHQTGLVINFLDTRIRSYSNTYAAYSLSKVALEHLTKMAALELGPDIRVNGIAPGATLPPVGKGVEYLQKIAEKTPMMKPGGIRPILQSIDYIIENEYLTGQILYCDGGEQLI